MQSSRTSWIPSYRGAKQICIVLPGWHHHLLSFEDHLQHIEMVFERLEEAGLNVKLSKCEFFWKQLQFLGHVISDTGLQPDMEMPPPQTIKEVHSFTGMCSYYRRYFTNFSEQAIPIIALSRKNAKFIWSEDCQMAFDYLKTCFTNTPVLAHVDPQKPYVLYMDAS